MFEDVIRKIPKKEDSTANAWQAVQTNDIKCPYCSSTTSLKKGILVHYKQYWRQQVVCQACEGEFNLIWHKDMTQAYIELTSNYKIGVPTKS